MAENRSAQERELVQRCLSGSAGAWKDFFEQYGPFLEREIRFLATRFLRRDDPRLVEELAQEVYQAILNDRAAVLRNFRWDCSLKHYLSVVVWSHVGGSLRRRFPSVSLDSAVLDEAGWKQWLSREAPDTARLLEREETLQEVRKALERLPPRERLALQLHYLDAVPADELTRLFSVSRGTLHVLLHRARERLRELVRGLHCL